MKISLFLIPILFLISNSTHACPGPSSEVAQDRDASIVFVGKPTYYELDESTPKAGLTSGALAKVSFDVTKTIRGESRKQWVVFMRGMKLPQSLFEFKEKFGTTMKVGIRDFGNSESVKPPKNSKSLWFIVDAACSTNHGENWYIHSKQKILPLFKWISYRLPHITET